MINEDFQSAFGFSKFSTFSPVIEFGVRPIIQRFLDLPPPSSIFRLHPYQPRIWYLAPHLKKRRRVEVMNGEKNALHCSLTWVVVSRSIKPAASGES